MADENDGLKIDARSKIRLIAIVVIIAVVTLVAIIFLILRDGGQTLFYTGTYETAAGWNEIRIYNSGDVYCRGRGEIENDTGYQWVFEKKLTVSEMADFKEKRNDTGSTEDDLKYYIKNNIGCYSDGVSE